MRFRDLIETALPPNTDTRIVEAARRECRRRTGLEQGGEVETLSVTQVKAAAAVLTKAQRVVRRLRKP